MNKLKERLERRKNILEKELKVLDDKKLVNGELTLPRLRELKRINEKLIEINKGESD